MSRPISHPRWLERWTCGAGNLPLGLVLTFAILGALLTGCSKDGEDGEARGTGQRPVAVEVGPVDRRSLEIVRTFSGALESESRMVVSPKVGGRIVRLPVDLADPVERGQVVAELDADEFIQAMRQAEAELAVARAELRQAENAADISKRDSVRVAELRERGIASDAEYDLSHADLLQKEGEVHVAVAQIRRAEAALEAARIRHDYTRVTADWIDGDPTRRVAERFVDEGQTVAANEPLLRIVQLDPIVAVLSVAERDYGRLTTGVVARITTDAVPGGVFTGKVERIAPVFQTASRQARIEVGIPNPDHLLKPGMFVRATLSLGRVENAVVVPEAAVTRRGEVDGVFAIDASGTRVSWRPIRLGLRADGWVQVLEGEVSGSVVTLGQHLIDDGSTITVVETPGPSA